MSGVPRYKLNFLSIGTDTKFLFADSRGYIYAIWLNAKKELSYSFVPAIGFEKKQLWSRVQVLAAKVEGFDVDQDPDGNFHLAFMRTSEDLNQPAGVYYRHGKGAGYPWTTNKLLYESRYFRSINADTAHIQLASTKIEDRVNVYAVWDHRPLRQLFFAKSLDGGSQWAEPEIIDGPTEIDPDAAPFNLMAQAYGSNILLLWTTGLQSGVDCTQISQFSTDEGVTWVNRQSMFETLPGCPNAQKIFPLDDGFILMATIQDQVYMLAWNGVEWSEPELQSPLGIFSDPEVFNTVVFRCQQMALIGRELIVIGCDKEGDSDIWLLSRSLGELGDWFAKALEWQSPIVIQEEQINVNSPLIVCDVQNRKHILWSQSVVDAKNRADTAIYYARQENSILIGPDRILNTPELRVAQPSIATDRDGRLLVVWDSKQTGDLYFSLASPALAHNVFNWSKPLSIPVVQSAATSPDILVALSGRILVVYAIQINEKRGIYIAYSDDDGKSWNEPVEVFNASASGWYGADHPNLTQTGDGILHLSWTRKPLSSDENAIAYYYARSSDGGQTWEQPKLVTDDVLSTGTLIAQGENNIHRFWLSQGRIPGVWHDYSNDSGNTWSPSINLTGLGETPGQFYVVADELGRLHSVQVIRDNLGDFAIKYMVWSGIRWHQEDVFRIGDLTPGQIQSVNACVNSDDMLSVIYVVSWGESFDVRSNEGLYITNHILGSQPYVVPATAEQRQPIDTIPTQAPTATLVAPTSTIEPQPRTLPSQTGHSELSQDTPTSLSQQWDTAWFGPALGLGLAFLVVLASIIVIYKRKRQGYLLVLI